MKINNPLNAKTTDKNTMLKKKRIIYTRNNNTSCIIEITIGSKQKKNANQTMKKKIYVLRYIIAF